MGDRDEEDSTTNTASIQKYHPEPQVFCNINGWYDGKSKYLRFWNMYLVRIKIPGQMPPTT